MTRHSILVVDDSPTDRHFLSELLLSQGYHVTAVDNGEAALAAIKSNPPHLVIMDVVMPGQNGFQATREIIRRVSQHLAELIADISSSAQQQALVSDSVSRNIDSILTVTEHTRHGTQQTAGSIQELAELAKALENAIQRFQIG